MKMTQALRLAQLPRLAVVGAGGKTTLLFQIGREIIEDKNNPVKNVVITTTTHLASWQAALADQHLLVECAEQLDGDRFDRLSGLVVITGREEADQRLTGLNESTLAKLLKLANVQNVPLLVEADGARLKPLKAPGEHEPAIPGFVNQVVVCAGMKGIGKPLTTEWVHRAERFSELSGLKMGQPVTSEAISSVLISPEGGLKHIPANAQRRVLLTQADTPELEAEAHSIGERLLPYFDGMVISKRLSSVPDKENGQIEVLNVHEAVAGIVLAAGGASRFGRAKQLLDWQGKPFVRQVAETALQAGLSPVIVVIGAYADEVSKVIKDLPVHLVLNTVWDQGQATSVVQGINAVPEKVGAAVFLLSDQPQVSWQLVHSLVETHQQSLAAIVAPLVDGQRGNPILFDRNTFNDLTRLRYEQGGRELFSNNVIQWLPWHDPNVLLDVDTVEDYQILIERSNIRQK